MKLRFGILMSIGLFFVVTSIGSIGLVFIGLRSFKWVAYIGMPLGAIFIITCSVLAMAGKIEKSS